MGTRQNRRVAGLTIGALAALAGCSDTLPPKEGDRAAPSEQRAQAAIEQQAADAPGANDDAPELGRTGASAPQLVGTDGLAGRSLAAIQLHQRLLRRLPSAKLHWQGDRVRSLSGILGHGSTSSSAAEQFRVQLGEALLHNAADLVPKGTKSGRFQAGARESAEPEETQERGDGVGLMYNPETGKYKFRLYAFSQQRDGIPVFQSEARVLVREDAQHSVVWANTDVRPLGDFHVDAEVEKNAVDLEKSRIAVTSAAFAPNGLELVGAPEATIFAGAGVELETPRLALRYVAKDLQSARKWTFVADAATGNVLHQHSELHFDVDGSVRGEVVSGGEAPACGTLSVEALPFAEVTSAVGSAYADQAGNFTLVESGNGSVSLTSTVSGQYFSVIDASGELSSQTLTVTPPGPASFVHSDPDNPPALVLAQLNAYKHANDIRQMLLDHVPEYPVISGETDFQIYVNKVGSHPMDLCVGTGGAWYDNDSTPASLNFCQEDANQANSAIGSIIQHEYGHHIVEMAQSGQLAYGEGMADTIAMLFAKDPAIGLGYRLDCSEPLRHADRHCDFDPTDGSSCGSGIYEIGAVLSGTVWDLWQSLSGMPNVDAYVRSLVFSSIPMHSGSSVDASIALDFLVLDDDDGIVENGTPHRAEICQAFEDHNMECPPLEDGLIVQGESIYSEGPRGGPLTPASFQYTLHNIGPETNLSYTVSADVPWLTVSGGSGTIPLGDQATVTVALDNSQVSSFPVGRYFGSVSFVNNTTGEGNTTRGAALRVGVPQSVYTATFDSDLEGFTVDSLEDNLWHRTTACIDPKPGHSAPGSLYYGRDNGCSHSTNIPDRHTVTSPVITLENPEIVDIGLNYFLRTESINSDPVEISLSVNGGPFEVVASEDGPGAQLRQTVEWQALRFEVSDLLPSGGTVSIQLQFSFESGNPRDGARPGFAVDDINVYAASGDGASGVVIPSRIEAEDYVRYSDTTAGNEGGGCDTGDDVDKEVTGDVTGGCNVGWTDAGEWLEYDVTVTEAQSFDILSRVASDYADKTFRIEVDGVDVSGELSAPSSGWQNYEDVVAPGVFLEAGEHVVRFFLTTNYINVNYIDFLPVSGCENCSSVSLPARIEAEDYVRYNDTTAGNEGGGCDAGDDVDMEITGDVTGGCNVGWTQPGEWLEYDVSVDTAAEFDVVARVASDSAGKTFRVEVDGVDATGELSVPAAGWQSYQDVVAPGIFIAAGEHVVRFYFTTDYINLNYIEFLPASSGPSCGDEVCNGSETCETCQADCGECTTGGCTCESGCDAVISASAPLTRDGATDACFFLSGNSSYINSWNMSEVNINGQDITNTWTGSGSYPAAIDGGYYLYIDGDYGWSHLEVR